MRVVALISGGKDSCYNMMQCVAAGHEIVALANLEPTEKDEIDSYMYQTVGHDGIALYSDALGLPLFRRKIEGNALIQAKEYYPTDGDEVEDLYRLLLDVKENIDFDAVAVGAILSDYQRIRVENVCTRLGCVCLAYLWRRDQSELLQEMIDCGINAIIVKTASLGLDPDVHLGQTITEMKKMLLSGKKKYGINVCGEGGEYETFTLDCPLFQQAIVLDEYEKVIHSNDAFAPVGYLKLNKMHLVKKTATTHKSELDKESLTPTTECGAEAVNELPINDEPIESVISASTRQKNMLNGLSVKVKTPLDYLSDLVECHIADCCDGHMELCSQNHGQKDEDDEEDEDDQNKCRVSNEAIICNHRIKTALKGSISSSSIPLSLASSDTPPLLPSSSSSSTTPTQPVVEEKTMKESTGKQLDLNFIENQMSSVTLPSPSSSVTTPTQTNCPCQTQNYPQLYSPFVSVASNPGGWFWIMGIHDNGLLTNNKRNRRDDGQSLNNSNSNSTNNITEAVNPMKNALNSLLRILDERNLRVSDLVGVVIYVSDMSDYAQYNKEYLKIFSSRPPVRICVEAPLPSTIPVLLEALAYRNPNQNQSSVFENNDSNPTRHCMHVQGISHWAPANIGPYSQAIWVGDIIYVAGQIGLVPGSMLLVEGGARIECKLALRHINRVIKAVDPKVEMRDVVQGICYVTDAKFIEECRREWEKRTNNAIVEYLVVPRLPRDASVEWQIWAHKHNTAFEYEETGCYIGTEVKIRMIRRWNYECRVAVIVCTASISTPGSRFGRSEMIEMTEYALNKLNQESDEKSQNECAIRVFYRIGTSLNPSDLSEVLLNQSTKYNVAFSIIPVSSLVKDNAIISFCGVRHQ